MEETLLGRCPGMFPTITNGQRRIFARWRKPRQLGGKARLLHEAEEHEQIARGEPVLAVTDG